jgi:hypothetical protein
MSKAGDEIDLECPKCGLATHIVVAVMQGKVAAVLCRGCGRQCRHSGPDAAVQRLPGDLMDPTPPPARGARVVDRARTRALARRLPDLEAITHASAMALARAERLTQVGNDRYEGLRFSAGNTHALLVFDLRGEAAHVTIAEAARRGKHLDALFTEVCADVSAELGPASKTGRDAHKSRWACWRAPKSLLFALQIDDFITQDREAVKLWLTPSTADGVPDVGRNVADWLTGRARSTNEGR